MRSAFAEPANEKTPGAIEGVVTYRADPERPWRFARYYVKDKKTGCLAEAVVSLAGDGLKTDRASDEVATTTVDQKDFQFVPETVVVRAGDRVKFTNSDAAVHNVQAFHELGSFNINMPAGGSHTETFARATGVRRPFRIGCVYHGGMRAWVFVFDHPQFQLSQIDGRYRLASVPPGEYTLELSHPAGQLRWSKRVTVKAGETTRLDIVLSPDDRIGKAETQESPSP